MPADWPEHRRARPLFHRRRHGVVKRLLRQIEISKKANERGEHAARLLAINRFQRSARVFGEALIHKQAWDLSPGRPIASNVTSVESDSQISNRVQFGETQYLTHL